MHEHNDGAIRVLLVSDLPIVAWGLERLIDSLPALELAGAAASYGEALALLGAGTVDVVVVDVDGSLAAHGIGVLRDASQVKVLALTVSGHVGLRDSAVLAGASGVVGKGEPVSVFASAIQKIHAGELWLDRAATNRIFLELARRKAADPEHRKIALLTRKERRVVAEIAGNASTTGRDIARILHISEHTLRNHLTSVYAKLELRSRLELYAYAHRHEIPET
ncbi:MAG: LuxR C-terminal-related transcriptional regulator [Immundisolibacter sp.]|uniref:LuxR C-terminal-related transcriptional regulator n=1 Tax=Immundisolibacter sp. TaxID=1934948 RepID=UPI003EDF39FA